MRTSLAVKIVLLFIVIYALGVYMYATVRFRGHGIDSDTLTLTDFIDSAASAQSIFDARTRYSNGVSYQTVALQVMRLTGLTVQQIQLFVLPAFAALLVVIAFTCYREFIGNDWTALGATLLLFLQPDFLFATWRGSHEKVTWMLAITLLYLLTRSFRADKTLPGNRILFYIIAPAFLASNAFFASTFVAALAFAFVAGLLFMRVRNAIHHTAQAEVHIIHQLQRMLFISMACGIMLYIFVFYLYSPALSLLYALDSLLERLVALFLNPDLARATDPYSYILATWIDPRIYFFLSIISFGTAFGSAFVWLIGGFRLLKEPHLDHRSLPRLFLWLLYPAFVLQLIAGIFADRSNSFGANIQVRLLAPVMIIAIPIVAIGFQELLRRIRHPRLKVAVVGTVALILLPVSILSLFKVTNEPLLSNQWIFSTMSERVGATWAVSHALYSDVWVGASWRLVASISFDDPDIRRTHVSAVYPPPLTARLFVISDLQAILEKRNEQPRPASNTNAIIYDNGQTQVHYQYPGTGFPY